METRRKIRCRSGVNCRQWMLPLLLIVSAGKQVSPFQFQSISRQPSIRTVSCGLRLSAASENASRDKVDHTDQNPSYWLFMFCRLMLYKEENGHVYVPCNHAEEGWKLGGWLEDQKARYSQNRLSPPRQRQLEDLGVSWDDRSVELGSRWETMYNLLSRFQRREGQVLVPWRHVEEGENLGSWLIAQRQERKNGSLSADRKHKLEALDVCWEPHATRWEFMYGILLDYQKREGHVHVSQGHIEAGEKLGRWLAAQRKFMKHGSLAPDRQQRLEALDVCWEPNATRWEYMYGLLTDFQKREGHVLVARRHQEVGKNLGFWLAGQRDRLKTGALSADRQQRLAALGVTAPANTEQD